jgi:hypothetical protein
MNPESRTLLPGIAFADFGKRFREPKIEEGFQDIVRVDFQFQLLSKGKGKGDGSGGGDGDGDNESDSEEEKRRMWSQFYI